MKNFIEPLLADGDDSLKQIDLIIHSLSELTNLPDPISPSKNIKTLVNQLINSNRLHRNLATQVNVAVNDLKQVKKIIEDRKMKKQKKKVKDKKLKRLEVLAKAVRAYISSDDEDRFKEFDAMHSALIKFEELMFKVENE